MDRKELLAAVARVADFLDDRPLTSRLADLERSLAGSGAGDAGAIVAHSGVDKDLLAASLVVSATFGQIHSLIHAAAVSLLLPRLLEPGERITSHPSLAAGNDPNRPFDLETDRRVAEFKFSHWKGSDAARKRQVFKDLVQLAAADTDGRRPELYVRGSAPIRFLTGTASTAGWGLKNNMAVARLFSECFGPLENRISEFRAGPAAHVRLVDLDDLAPDLLAILAASPEIETD